MGLRFDAANNAIYLDEQAAPGPTSVAGQGTLWIRDDTPNTLVFTDDAGTDVVIAEGGAIAAAPSPSMSFNYLFDTDTAFTEPADGELKFNNATYTSASVIYFSGVDADGGGDVKNALESCGQAQGSMVRIYAVDHDWWAIYRLTSTNPLLGLGSNGKYSGCGYVGGFGTLPADGEAIVLEIYPAGTVPPAPVNTGIMTAAGNGGWIANSNVRYRSTSGFDFYDGGTQLGSIYYSTGANLFIENIHPSTGTIQIKADQTVIASEAGSAYATFTASAMTLASGIALNTSNATFSASGTGGYQAGSFGFYAPTGSHVESPELRLAERTTGPSAAATYGYLWVKDDAPTSLYYTDDTGQEIQVAPYRATVQTTNATQTEIISIPVASGTTFGYRINIVGNEAATGDTVFESIFGAIHNQAGTTAIVGSDIVDRTEDAGAAAWVVTVAADDTTDALTVDVTGEASHTIDWKVSVEILDV